MRRLSVCVSAAMTVAAVVAISTSVAPAKSGQGTLCVLHAKLTAGAETTGSTSTATGDTRITVSRDGTITENTHILNPDQETFFAGHIHEAPAGDDGPVVVPLFGPPDPPTSATDIRSRGEVTPNQGTTGAELCENPSAFYVNYHTTAFTGGAIRGQLGG